jgi:hypothetical protein
MPGGHEQVDPLLIQLPRRDPRRAGLRRERRDQAHVQLTVGQSRPQHLRAALDQGEPDVRMRGPVVAQQPRDRLRAQRVQEPERDPAVPGIRLGREAGE